MLKRRLGLAQSVSLNAAMMVGIGPFLTIPLMVKEMHGPAALAIWAIGALLAICDGMVWSELASAFPGSGGTYHYYDAVYGESWLGRALKFLFVWQFLFSAPLEIASGAIGLIHYAGYFGGFGDHKLYSLTFGNAGEWTFTSGQAFAMLVLAALTLGAYRRVEATGRMMIALAVGMAVTILWMILSGLPRMSPSLVFSLGGWSEHSLSANLGSSGIALGLAMYCYFGYYQVCYLGDEVIDPSRTIPKSILISVIVVAIAYLSLNFAMLGVIPWQKMELYESNAGSVYMGILQGKWAASLVTGLILWTAAAGAFAALLGYARVPYAASRAGHFFCGLAATHPTGDFPHRSLLLVAGLSILACLADLETLIKALMTSRILIQFAGQILTVIYIRRRPELEARLTFRMWLYPAPAGIALVGWLVVFVSTSRPIIAYGLGSMLLGLGIFWVWDLRSGKPANDPSGLLRRDDP